MTRAISSGFGHFVKIRFRMACGWPPLSMMSEESYSRERRCPSSPRLANPERHRGGFEAAMRLRRRHDRPRPSMPVYDGSMALFHIALTAARDSAYPERKFRVSICSKTFVSSSHNFVPPA